MQHRALTWLVVVAVSTLVVPVAAGQEWPQWRGPNRDGAVTSFREPATWPDALTQHWTVEVGLGYATPLLVGDRIYMYTRQDDDEVMVAIDARDGSIIWRTSYPRRVRHVPGHGPSPRWTEVDAGLCRRPAVHAGDKWHRLSFQRRDRTAALAEARTVRPAALPHGDVSGGRRQPGDVSRRWAQRWGAHRLRRGNRRHPMERGGRRSGLRVAMVFELGGTRQVVTFTQAHLVGVAVATGELLWRRPYTTPNDTTSQTPILYGDTVIETGRTQRDHRLSRR